MGALVRGKPEEQKWTMGEISEVSGIKQSTLQHRRRLLGIPSKQGGYTYEQAKALMRKPIDVRKPSRSRMDRLRQQLRDDGFKVT